MKLKIILSFTILILLISCRFETVNPKIEQGSLEAPQKPSFVSLENPKPGQKSMFLNYQASCNYLESSFKFTKDTLVLEVFEENDTLYFEESLTRVGLGFPTSFIGRYPVFDEEEQLIIPERWVSELFDFYDNDTLHLQPQKTVPLYKIGCRLFFFQGPFIGNEIGIIDDFTFGEVEIKDKIVVSCVPTPPRVEAYLAYSSEELFMSHQILNDTLVRGWIKLDDN